MRTDIKFTILQMANLGHGKRNQVSRNKFWVRQPSNRAETGCARIACVFPVIVSSQQPAAINR
ncbi:hypothetical protein QUB63_05180 [Microcoleus sp. ARI1-B5]|uniref:hypothetical protein n=1 Tax=unclassified Microcoleus TaxID=2642155 RepID=UPI002FCF54D5